MVKKQSSASKTTSLFDIRLKNLDHDVLVLKGNEQDAASALMVGKIVISLNEPITVKRISLRLYASLRLDWVEQYQTSKGVIPKPMKFSKKIYEHYWDPNELKSKVAGLTSGTDTTGSTSPSLSRNQSSTSLKGFGFRSKSSSQLSALHNNFTSSSSSNLSALGSHHSAGGSGTVSVGGGGSSSGNGGMLGQGNHEIPFSAILPGDMPESVEGLPGGSVVYKLEAMIERGKFHTPLIAKKHVRVVRTLTTDAVELSETVAVDNTWAKKVEYSLNVPSKAIAVGSAAPISFMLVPLLKGLRLGDIKIQLVEHYSYIGYLPPPHSAERILAEKFLPRPSEDDPNFFGMDRWEVDTFVRIPDTLSKCTQDCDIQNHIRVRHKFKFVIGLINPDGHTSELRASLPITIFISPFISIRAKYDNDGYHSDSSSIHDGAATLSGAADTAELADDEELLFSSDLHSGSHTSLNQLGASSGGEVSPEGVASGSHSNDMSRNLSSVNSFGGFVAPPVYERHVYDRLWGDISPIDTPINSGSATPSERSYQNLAAAQPQQQPGNLSSQFSMSPLDTQKLTENLRQLSLQRQQQEEGSGSSDSRAATFNLGGGESSSQSMAPSASTSTSAPAGTAAAGGAPAAHDDYFSVNLGRHVLDTPGGVLSPPAHLSRVGSETVLNSANMVKVPSYHQAIRSDLNEEPLSPAYEPPLPGSNINLVELNRKFDELHAQQQQPPQSGGSGSSLGHSRNKSLLSRGSSSLNLKSLSNSRPSSTSTSPSNSRNVSYTNLSVSPNVANAASLSRTASKKSINSQSNSNSNSTTNMFTLTPSSTSGSAAIPIAAVPQAAHTHTNRHGDAAGPPEVSQLSSSASDRSAQSMRGIALGNTSSTGTGTLPAKSSSSLNLSNLPFLHKKKPDHK